MDVRLTTIQVQVETMSLVLYQESRPSHPHSMITFLVLCVHFCHGHPHLNQYTQVRRYLFVSFNQDKNIKTKQGHDTIEVKARVPIASNWLESKIFIEPFNWVVIYNIKVAAVDLWLVNFLKQILIDGN